MIQPNSLPGVTNVSLEFRCGHIKSAAAFQLRRTLNSLAFQKRVESASNTCREGSHLIDGGFRALTDYRTSGATPAASRPASTPRRDRPAGAEIVPEDRRPGPGGKVYSALRLLKMRIGGYSRRKPPTRVVPIWVVRGIRAVFAAGQVWQRSANAGRWLMSGAALAVE